MSPPRARDRDDDANGETPTLVVTVVPGSGLRTPTLPPGPGVRPSDVLRASDARLSSRAPPLAKPPSRVSDDDRRGRFPSASERSLGAAFSGSQGDDDGWVHRDDDDDGDDDDDDARRGARTKKTLVPRAIRARVVRALDSIPSQCVLLLALTCALFLVDAVAYASAPDRVDFWVAVTLCVTLLLFVLELAANSLCRDAYAWSFFFWMDLIGNAAIVADVEWLSRGWLPPDGASSVGPHDVSILSTFRVARAARVGARVQSLARVARMFPVLRLCRTCAGGGGGGGYTKERKSGRGDGTSAKKKKSGVASSTGTGNIARNLRESMSKIVAILVILTIFAAPMLTWDDSYTIPSAYFASLKAVSAVDGGGAALTETHGDAIGAEFFDFFQVGERKPVALALGNRTWDFSDSFSRSRRSTDRLEITAGACDETWSKAADAGHGECVAMELNIAPVNQWTALMNMGMVMFVVAELVLISALLARVTSRQVIVPLDRIFENMKKNMDKITGAFRGKMDGGGDDGDDDDDGGMHAMEASIEKLTRLVKHVAGSGAQGGHMFNEYVNDANVDEKTRAWLNANYGGGGGGGGGGSAAAAAGEPSGDDGAVANDGDAPTVVVGLGAAYKSAPDSPSTGTGGGGKERERKFSVDSGDAGDDARSDDDEFSATSPFPLRAGPELQLRQARKRSRTRMMAANAAASAAAACDIPLPPGLDHTLINTWDFDVLSLSSEETRAYVLLMFGALGLLRSSDDARPAPKASLNAEQASTEGFCDCNTIWNFLVRVEGGYRANPYHNWQHAVDVTHTVYRFIVITELRTHITQVEKFALMIAALSHDLDHPGVSNAFLVNAKDTLATVYNDNSVLENSHIACLYSIIHTRQTRGVKSANGDVKGAAAMAAARIRTRSVVSMNAVHEDADSDPPEEDVANVFAALDDPLYREVRKIIIATVLHTDMSHHFKMVSQMEVFYEIHSAGIKANTRRVNRGVMVDCIYDKPDDRQFILNVILHAADISNAVKPFKTYEKWAHRVLGEFFNQGDMERARGVPISPMMDSSSTNAASSQINFIEFIFAPLYASFVKLFPETAALVGHMVGNRIHYQAVLESELDGGGGGGGATSAIGCRAGEGKNAEAKSHEKLTTRNRFKALVEKHDLLKGPAGSFFAGNAAFHVLTNDAETTGGNGGAKMSPLSTATTRAFAENSFASLPRARQSSVGSGGSSQSGLIGSPGGNSRRTFVGGAFSRRLSGLGRAPTQHGD